MEHVNPANESREQIEEELLSNVENKVLAAKQAQKTWRKLSHEKRAEILRAVIPEIEKRTDELALAICHDMGKPVEKAKLEVQRFIDYIEFNAKNVAAWLAPEDSPGGMCHYYPIGVVAVISPWNFPLAVPVSGIVPALISGSAVVFKPSEYAPRTGRALAECFYATEQFPNECLQLIIGGKEHGKALVAADVGMIAFTGSTAAGKNIMQEAGRGIKRVLLELGGLDATIVCADANIQAAAEAIVKNNCTNTGQVCCAIKRVYVEENVYPQFIEEAKKVSNEITFGNPETDVDMGPLVADFQRDKVHRIVEDARKKGANISTGGSIPEGKGFFYPSTIIEKLSEDMAVLSEEPFGPVLPVVTFTDLDTAIEKANATPYGLMASVWTEDIDKGQRVACELEAGTVGINKHGGGPLGSPFGGVKQSGLGHVRTKDSLRSFCNLKFVHIGEL